MTRRADRLFEIIQKLRRARGPLTAEVIASELETSKRTIYRDISALVARRVPIRGEAGTGYVLDRNFDLGPLSLTLDEIEAVVLGIAWVTEHADPPLARAASTVLSKLSGIVPGELRALIENPSVGVPPRLADYDESFDLGKLRSWIQKGRKVRLRYGDANGRETERTVWPFLLGYHEGLRALMAWCELREDSRIFRVDRLRAVVFLDEPYPEKPSALRRAFLEKLASEKD